MDALKRFLEFSGLSRRSPPAARREPGGEPERKRRRLGAFETESSDAGAAVVAARSAHAAAPVFVPVFVSLPPIEETPVAARDRTAPETVPPDPASARDPTGAGPASSRGGCPSPCPQWLLSPPSEGGGCLGRVFRFLDPGLDFPSSRLVHPVWNEWVECLLALSSEETNIWMSRLEVRDGTGTGTGNGGDASGEYRNRLEKDLAMVRETTEEERERYIRETREDWAIRGGGSSSSSNNNNNRRGTPNSGRGASRWDHLDAPRDGNDRGNRNRNRGRFGFDANSNSNSNPNTNGNRSHQEKVASKGNKPTASRWANVNRSAIEAGGSSGRSPGRSPPRFGARQNHHSNRHPNNSQHVRAVFFGDSFIKLFGLLNDYSDSVLRKPRTIEVHKYKAASAKGLCRDGNENRACIRRVVDRLQQHQYPNLERLVFCFGDVDVHMSYYYKKFVVGQALTETDLEAIACDYVDFVAGLPVPEPASLRRLVVGIYPSPLGDGDVGASLKAYGSLDTLEQVEAVNASDDRKMEARQARVQLFNDALRERCAHHNRIAESQGRDPVLEYHDVQDELLTTTTISAREDGSPDDSPREVVVVRDAYRDVSDLNIHLIHETTLQLWVEKWPWYKALTLPPEERHDRRPPPIGFVEYLQKTFDEYRKTKPWAERTHVAETMGVQLPPSSS